MLQVLHLSCLLGTLLFLRSAESGFYDNDFDNEVYDYYRQESSNNVQSTVPYVCKQEGFHEDPNDCRIFYRCVDWGNGGPLTPFKFECGTGTVFSKSRGNVCVHFNDSGRPECCEPGNEIDSNEPDYQEQQHQRPEKPNYPQTKPPTQRPQQPSYPSTPGLQQSSYYPQTQKPQPPSYPSTQNQQKPSYPSQSQQPSYPSKPIQPSYPSQSQQLDKPSSGCNSELSSCGSSFGCLQEGFFSDPKDCYKFYRCVNEGTHIQRYNFTCGAGTAWDQTLQTCNYEHEVASCNIGGSQHTDSGFPITSKPSSTQSSQTSQQPGISYPVSSSRPTYKPQLEAQSSTHPSAQKPTKPSYPVQQTEKPQYPTQSQYPSQLPTQSPPQSTKGPEYIPPAQGPSSNTLPSSGTGTIPTEVPGIGGRPCPPIGSSSECKEEGFFSNPENCHKFYRCVNEDGKFHKYDFECGTGTAWDQELQTCNYEDKVCSNGNSIGQVPQSGVSPGSQQSGSGMGPEGQKPEGQQPGGGYEPGHSTQQPGTSLPPVTQSSQSTMQPGATQGTIPPIHTTLGITKSTTESSESTKEIGAPTTSQQTHQQTTSSGVQSTTPSQQSSQQPQQTMPSSGSQSTNAPQKPGSGSCQSEGFFANPNNCKKFYRCVANGLSYIKYDFDCAPGTAWDQNLLTCNYIHLVESCDMSLNEVVPSQPQPDESSIAPQPNGPTSQPPSGESMGAPSSNGTSTPSPNQTTQHPEDNKTEPAQSGQTSSSEGTSTESSSAEDSSSSKPSSSTVSSKPDCSPPSKNNTIVCNVAGFYPHPIRCDKFYRCVDNGRGFNVYYFDCPPGTIFDPSLDICNYPESVYPARDCETGGQTSVPSQPSAPSLPPSTTQVPTSVESTTKPSNIDSTTMSSNEGTTTSISESTTESSTESQTNGPTGNSSEMTTPSSSETSSSSSETTTSILETTTGNSETTMSSNSEATTSSSEGTTSESESTTMSSTGSMETTTIGSTETTATSAEATTTGSEESSVPIETTTPPIATTESSESTTMTSNEKPSSIDNCPTLANLTDEQVVLVCPTGFRRHPKLCNLFYQCTSSGMEVKILILQCPEGTIFDEKENKCLAEAESSQACMGTIAGKRTRRITAGVPVPVEVSAKPLCPEEGHFPYRDGCSNVFYKCQRDSRYNLQGYLYKCPKDFVYWSVSRRCERASRLPMCTSMSDEAENENETWENRWEIPVEDRNLSARSLLLY